MIFNTLQHIHKTFCADVEACVFVYNEALTPLAIETHDIISALLDARERNVERIYLMVFFLHVPFDNS